MTWQQLWEEVRKRTSSNANADNIIGHLMDDFESYDWNAEAPAEAEEVLYA